MLHLLVDSAEVVFGDKMFSQTLFYNKKDLIMRILQTKFLAGRMNLPLATVVTYKQSVARLTNKV